MNQAYKASKIMKEDKEILALLTDDVKLVLPWPPSVNHYYNMRAIGKRIIRFIGKKGLEFRKEVKSIVIPDLDLCNIFKKPNRLKVQVLIHSPDRRRRDIDNLQKSLLDALQHAGVYDDDTQIDELHIKRDVEDIVKNGQVTVHISVL